MRSGSGRPSSGGTRTGYDSTFVIRTWDGPGLLLGNCPAIAGNEARPASSSLRVGSSMTPPSDTTMNRLSCSGAPDDQTNLPRPVLAGGRRSLAWISPAATGPHRTLQRKPQAGVRPRDGAA